jgi:hypothetical protein
VVVGLCTTSAGLDGWADIERFGPERLDWLRTYLWLQSGIPSHDTFGRVFSRLDPAKLAASISQWPGDIGKKLEKHIAIEKRFVAHSTRSAGRILCFWF